jgi:hypothetical protein
MRNFDAQQIAHEYRLGVMGQQQELPHGCMYIDQQDKATFGNVETYSATAIHDGRASFRISRSVADAVTLGRQKKSSGQPLIFTVRRLGSTSRKRNSRRSTAKRNRKCLHGYLTVPLPLICKITQSVNSQQCLAEEEFRSLCTRPDVVKRQFSKVGNVSTNARQLTKKTFDVLCGMGLLTGSLDMLSQKGNAPSSRGRIQEESETAFLIAQHLMSDILSSTESIYFGSPTLYQEAYAKFETASDLYEVDELSGLLLGLVQDLSNGKTILPVTTGLLEKGDVPGRGPPGILTGLDSLDTLSCLSEDLRYCQ